MCIDLVLHKITMPAISSTAKGKTILFGEHAVVYGSPAIAVPINSIYVKAIVQPSIDSPESTIWLQENNSSKCLNLTELAEDNLFRGLINEFQDELNCAIPPFILTIASRIPIAAGLGSSAAIAVAMIRALGKFSGKKLPAEIINRIAYRSEVIQHGTPSGIDNSVIAYEKPIFFEKEKPLEFLQIKKNIHLVLADSGERALTKNVVRFVRESMLKDQTKYQELFTQIGNIAHRAKTALENSDCQLVGSLMTENHQLLKEIGVSSQKLDQLVNTAIEAGAYGGKLCGGGQGGFMVAVCSNEKQSVISDQLEKISPHVIKTSIGEN
jgi:mevalonate kinase